jgi:hypothetical protein
MRQVAETWPVYPLQTAVSSVSYAGWLAHMPYHGSPLRVASGTLRALPFAILPCARKNAVERSHRCDIGKYHPRRTLACAFCRRIPAIKRELTESNGTDSTVGCLPDTGASRPHREVVPRVCSRFSPYVAIK